MTNRLELNWKVDGFVDEQRYYCSETPIDSENLPVPKAVLAENIRAYTDFSITEGATYYICIGSVKNAVEKLSEIAIVTTAMQDEYLENVVALIHFDDGFNDEKGHTPVASGNPYIQSSVSKFGSAVEFDGSSKIDYGISSDFAFGNGAFTIEGFLRRKISVEVEVFISLRIYGSGNAETGDGCMISLRNGILSFSADGVWNDGALVSASAFQHFAICRDISNNIKIFLDGALVSSFLTTHNFGSSRRLVIGASDSTANPGYFSGYLDEVRITKGVCRYVNAFTPPMVPF